MTDALLEIEHVSKSFGGVHAVSDVSLRVEARRIDGLIGPNGAGKSTLLALIAGSIQPDRGAIRFDGADVTRWGTARRARAGLVRTFQAASPIPELTARENVLLGFMSSYRSRIGSVLLRTSRMRREVREMGARAERLLDYCGLLDEADRDAGELPFGQLRLLEVARALAANPRLVLLDEPGAGLNGIETERLGGLLRRVRDNGTAVLVVDHDVSFLFGLCDSVALVDFGHLVITGSADEVRRSEQLTSVYLGSSYSEEVGEE